MSFRLIQLPEVDSTNTYIKQNRYLWEENYSLVFTFNQTAGRGQNERTWSSQKNKDIAFSFIFHPHESIPTKYISCITLYVSLAILRVLKRITGVDLTIKWPNDIQSTSDSGVDKKLAGILCELLIENGKPIVLLGVGVNVNSTTFSTELTPKVTSVKILAKRSIKKKPLLLALWSEIKLMLANFAPPMGQQLINEILKSFSLLGKKVVYFDSKKRRIDATILGIDPLGLLMVKDLVSEKVYTINHNVWFQLSTRKPT